MRLLRHRRFVSSLQHYSPSTIVTYVAGVGCHFKLSGGPDPTGTFIMTKMLEGCRRGDARLDQRSPISPPLLAKILAVLPFVCSSIFEVKLFRAAMLLAFFRIFAGRGVCQQLVEPGYMRMFYKLPISTFWVPTRVPLQSLSLCPCSIARIINMAPTKDQYWSGCGRLPLPSTRAERLCQGSAQDAWHFVLPTLMGYLSLNFNSTRFCRRHCHGWGFRGAHFQSHSFRTGAASAAFSPGGPCWSHTMHGSLAFRRFTLLHSAISRPGFPGELGNFLFFRGMDCGWFTGALGNPSDGSSSPSLFEGQKWCTSPQNSSVAEPDGLWNPLGYYCAYRVQWFGGCWFFSSFGRVLHWWLLIAGNNSRQPH